MPKVVTANTLATGRVVFLDGAGAWVEDIGRARQFEDTEAADLGLASARTDEEKAVIVDPFIAEIAGEHNGRPKMTLRDTIRAFGPTIDFHPRRADAPSQGA